MTEITYNSRYLMKDNEPWFPVMGEIHYSRYRSELWEEELRKMKAGGVSVVSVYCIWLHHEEQRGVFDFSGNRDLRAFLEVCRKVGIYVHLRLGPWVHGEARNGGFPDWLCRLKGVDLRSNDPAYLELVSCYWKELYARAEGLLLKDGGPVIGVQIENEYGHVGGYRGEKGEEHMRTLAKLAEDIGFRVELYTATGWGGAVTGGLLPVMGGYCEAPWDQRITELEPNTNYVFSHIRNDALIASDHHVDDTLTFRQEDFPYITAELGGGLQVTRHRRPIAQGSDIGAMSLTKLGSGVSLLGYYMYHGGSNPDSVLSTLQESRATGYANDLPEINYDFNAPLRQYGTISDSYREIRLLALFLQDFGADMAGLAADIVPENIRPGDMHTLRTSCRHDENHGYVFVNNYQRRMKMDVHENTVLTGICSKENVIFPSIDIAEGEYMFFPYNMKLDDAVLKYALASPLCRLKTAQGNVFVFYGDREPQFSWNEDKKARVLMLTRRDALNAARICLDQEYIVITDDFAWEEDGELRVTGSEYTEIRTFPELSELPEGFVRAGKSGDMYVYTRKVKLNTAAVSFREITLEERDKLKLVNSCMAETIPEADSRIYDILINYGNEERLRKDGRDTILEFDYACESMDIYMNGKKINDYFYTGQKALLSLGYFDFPERLTAVVRPLHEGDRIYLQTWPGMQDKCACRIDGISAAETFRQS